MRDPACASAAHGEPGGRDDADQDQRERGEQVPRAPASPPTSAATAKPRLAIPVPLLE